MSLHMSLQIFSPTSRLLGHDGLYRFRHSVFVLYVVFPLLDASMAFINTKHGYISQGPFCTLPLRPIWYRLALTWIPRYMIQAYIMYVALRIYMHVGRGFKVFARQQGALSSADPDLDSEESSTAREMPVVKNHRTTPSMQTGDQHGGLILPYAQRNSLTSAADPNHHPSLMKWSSSFTALSGSDAFRPAAVIDSARSSRVLFQDETTHVESLQIPIDQKRPRGSISTLSSFKSNGEVSAEGNRQPGLEPIKETRTDYLEDGGNVTSADTPLKKRRRAIQKQLRLLFIYPAVYMIMWAVPFVYHSMNYSDYYVQHPVYGLAVVSVICQTSLGFIDCAVFGWREKPWTQIPGSDGTFLGSFMFWRFNRGGRSSNLCLPITMPDQTPNEQVAGTQTGSRRHRNSMRSISHSTIRPGLHKKTWSGSSDRNAMDSERAAERLALERADRDNRADPHSRSSSLNANNRAPIEWWERRLSHAVPETPSKETDGFILE